MTARSAEGKPSLDELVRMTEGLQPWRRLFHVAGGLTIIAVVMLLGVESVAARWTIVAATVAAFGIDLIRLRSPAANRVFFTWLRPLASPREAHRVASSTWYLLGSLVVLLTAPPDVFLPAMLVLAIADPAASVVGRLKGRRAFGKGTWLGTAAFFATAFAVLQAIVDVQSALVAAAVTSLVEVVPWGIDDNVTVPITTALSLWWLTLLA